MWQKIKKIICSEAFMYLFIGGCTTLVNLVVFSVLTYGSSLGNSDLGITISNVISIVTLVIEVGGVWLAVSVIGQDKMIGKLETQVLVVIGNYFISKFLVFTGNKEDKE